MQLLHGMTDPRKPRGVRHPVATVLAIAVCAVLSGARSFTAIAEWAQSLSLSALRRMGSRRPEPPSEPTIRRVLQSIDAEEFDAQISAWLLAQIPLAGKAIALDGKTFDQQKADPIRLLELARRHWTIENRLHWVRDVTFDEDRYRIRKGNGPQVMASLRNLAISLLRMAGAKRKSTSFALLCQEGAACLTISWYLVLTLTET